MAPENITTIAGRREAMLPDLLTAVRWRGRRRRAVRATVFAILLGVPCYLAVGALRDRFAADRLDIATVPAWTTFRDDPTVVARIAVPTRSRSEWFVDDEALRGLLADARRPAGVVRAGDQVFVVAAAIDDWRVPGP